MKHPSFWLIAFSAFIYSYASQASQPAIEEVYVHADFHSTSLQTLATSATVVDANTIEARSAKHLAQVINIAPNVNFSSGASRGRFFQIRGIGERSQFVEPINPSVGLLIDGIDLTGIGAGATTFDIDQIEILRGPQGTLYGANALAGLINMISAAPEQQFGARLAAEVGNYNSRTFNGAITGPLGNTLSGRLAVSQHTSDGYLRNDFLQINDNGSLDEQTLRGKLRWQPHTDLSVDITGLYVDVDNGYDGFSLDNTRTTLSDEPGHDRQETRAGSVRLDWAAHSAFKLVGLVSHADSDLSYGYDEDWAFSDICVVFECLAEGYTSYDHYLRNNRNTSVDLRLVSRHEPGQLGWVVGTFSRDQKEYLHRQYTYLDEDFFSQFETENTAVYGQLDIPFGQHLTLVTGLRRENRDAYYHDSDSVSFNPEESFWGGKLALEYRIDSQQLLYLLTSRGYKAGGFNSNANILAHEREFSAEYLWNYEVGAKLALLDQRLQTQVAFFYQERDDVQTKQSRVQPIEGDICPCRFIDYTTNAAAGETYGVEFEAHWQATDTLGLFTSLGLLRSAFKDFSSFAHYLADEDTGEPFDLDGHDLPHAPRYMFNLGAHWAFANRWYLRVDMEGKDEFYFSSRHEAQADAYELFNARLGYMHNNWELAVWGRNLTDKDTKVRGFGSFGNDPRDGYHPQPYYQLGEPRMLGVSLDYQF